MAHSFAKDGQSDIDEHHQPKGYPDGKQRSLRRLHPLHPVLGQVRLVHRVYTRYTLYLDR